MSSDRTKAKGPEQSGPEFESADSPRHVGDDHMLLWAAQQARNGNQDAARDLFRMSARSLLCRDGQDISPIGRRILARALLRIANGDSVDKAVLLAPRAGRQRWRTYDRDIAIYGEMLMLIGHDLSFDGIDSATAVDETIRYAFAGIFGLLPEKPACPRLKNKDAANLIATSGKFNSISAKTILNIYLMMTKNPILPE